MKHVTQAGLRGALVTGRYAPYSKVTTAECVVIAVRYTDDDKNISKTHVEYDVRDLRTGQIYPNVRRADTTQGMDDGEENLLRPAQKTIGAVSPLFDAKTAQLSQSDGDRVKVAFGYGAQHSAVIVGVLPHPKMNYGTTRDQGFRRYQTHKGTSVEIQKDGTYQIKRGETTITIDPEETVEIVHKSGSKLRFNDNGDIELQPANELKCGSYRELDLEKTMRAETYRTAEDVYLAALELMVTAFASFPAMAAYFVANTDAAAALVAWNAAVQAFHLAPDEYLTTIVKVK